MGRIKICLACSAGGHLTEIYQLRRVFKKYPHFFLTFKRKDIETRLSKEKIFFLVDPKRNPIKFLFNFFQSLIVFLKERPNLIISTGAGIVIPFCYIAKFFGSKIIFIESMAATSRPSLSGKIIYPVADLFIVQWEELLKFYPRAIYGGNII